MENYPSDVSDEEWAFVAPYLTLFPLDAGQRKHSLREVFNAVRFVAATALSLNACPHLATVVFPYRPWVEGVGVVL